ncbi:hypothetical protein [Pseudoalteromonas sp. R3]|nr:hypothetical protein [Pseudoalteromonas sp. R3]
MQHRMWLAAIITTRLPAERYTLEVLAVILWTVHLVDVTTRIL